MRCTLLLFGAGDSVSAPISDRGGGSITCGKLQRLSLVSCTVEFRISIGRFGMRCPWQDHPSAFDLRHEDNRGFGNAPHSRSRIAEEPVDLLQLKRLKTCGQLASHLIERGATFVDQFLV